MQAKGVGGNVEDRKHSLRAVMGTELRRRSASGRYYQCIVVYYSMCYVLCMCLTFHGIHGVLDLQWMPR